MWKFSMFLESFAFHVLLLLALPPIVNSKEITIPRMCAVCLEKDCATGVREIYPTGSDAAVWVKANSQTEIQNCSMENLKADAPCKMANGSLVQLADETLHFEGIYTYGVRRVFNSQILSCADLNLPPSSTPSPVTKAPNIPVADNKGIINGIIIGSVIVIIIGIVIGIKAFFWKFYNCLGGLYRGCRQGNNRVPSHDAGHRDENTIEIQGRSSKWKR